MKITDKMRLDWVQRRKKTLKVYVMDEEIYWCIAKGDVDESWQPKSARRAIDAAIRAEKARTK